MGNQQTLQSPATTQAAVNAPATKPKASSFDPAHPTGIPTIDSGGLGPCKSNPAQTGCFLDKDQRHELVTQYLHALEDVKGNCKGALGELKVEQLIKKTDELPWYASLVVSAVAAVLTEGLSLLVSGGISVATGALAKEAVAAAETAINDASLAKMRALIELIPPLPPPPTSMIKAGVGKAVDAGKGALMPGITSGVSSGSENNQAKEAALGYIDYLNRALDQKFKDLAQTPPSLATDAELVALFKAIDISNHPQDFYVAKFRSQIDRYVHSHASKIGRHLAWDERRGNARAEIETRVAWLITRGAGRRLIYVNRAFSSAFERASQEIPSAYSRSSAYDSPTNQLSLRQDASWTTPFGTETRHETPLGPDLMLNYVEPDFVDVALQTQEHVWLAPPETFMLDYSYAPPRMVKVAS